jgi:deoxycytidylate deaminase
MMGTSKNQTGEVSDKFIHKYMRLAKQYGEDSNPCLSRAIGVAIVDPKANKVVGLGYNGPPDGTPHCDTHDYLLSAVWPQLSAGEIAQLKAKYAEDFTPESFAKRFDKCGECPRRLIDAPSGQRLDICSCAHAEDNAIINATGPLHGTYMFCWCGLPCWNCSKAIIRSKIARVYYFEWGKDYSPLSRWLLGRAGVEMIGLNKDDILSGGT